MDCWTCLLDCSCFVVDDLENNTKVLVLFELMDYTSKGGLIDFLRFFANAYVKTLVCLELNLQEA